MDRWIEYWLDGVLPKALKCRVLRNDRKVSIQAHTVVYIVTYLYNMSVLVCVCAFVVIVCVYGINVYLYLSYYILCM